MTDQPRPADQGSTNLLITAVTVLGVGIVVVLIGGMYAPAMPLGFLAVAIGTILLLAGLIIRAAKR